MALLVTLAGATWLAWPDPAPSGVPPELARAAYQLRVRESLYHRTVGRLARRLVPGMAAQFPRLLGTESEAPLRRLEACHKLVALGQDAAPALGLLVDAFCDPEHDVRAYAFISLVYVGAPAEEVAALVEERSPEPERQVAHCAGLLGDEDEMIREYAWRMVEAFREPGRGVVPVLEAIASQEYDPKLAERAARWLSQPATKPSKILE